MPIMNRNEIMKAYNESVQELRKNLADKYRTRDQKKNDKRLLERDYLMLQLLASIPKDVTLSGFGTMTDKNKMNAGHIAEMVLNYHHKREKIKRLALAGGCYDGLNGCISYEVKLCVNGSCYNTKLESANSVYLVTADGVFFIPKAQSMSMVNASGKFPYQKEKILAFEGVRLVKSLSIAMGFDLIEEEETEEE